MAKRKSNPEISLSSLLLPAEKRLYLDYLQRSASGMGGCRRMLIIDVLLNTGLRAVELCRLKVKHTPMVIGANVIEVYKGKYKKDRTIPISQRLAEAISNYITGDRKQNMPRHTKQSDTNGWLFYNQSRRRLQYQGLYKMVRRAGEKAGVKKLVRPHMLRHTFATNTLEKGTPITDLMVAMGHSHLATTERYLHVVGDRQFELAEAADTPVSAVFV